MCFSGDFPRGRFSVQVVQYARVRARTFLHALTHERARARARLIS